MKLPRYILGAPLKQAERKEFEDALLARVNNDMERANAYVDNVTSSQMSRAGGILASTSVLAGMSYFVKAPGATTVAFISVVIIASTLYTPWPATPRHVGIAELEFRQTCRRCYQRAICNRIGVSLIILTILLLVPYIFS